MGLLAQVRNQDRGALWVGHLGSRGGLRSEWLEDMQDLDRMGRVAGSRHFNSARFLLESSMNGSQQPINELMSWSGELRPRPLQTYHNRQVIWGEGCRYSGVAIDDHDVVVDGDVAQCVVDPSLLFLTVSISCCGVKIRCRCSKPLS